MTSKNQRLHKGCDEMIVCVRLPPGDPHEGEANTACSHSVSELAQVVYIFMGQERHRRCIFFSFTRRVEVEDNCYYSTITKLKSYHDAPCAAMQHIFDEPA